MRGTPVGRQFASGSSLDCLDFMSFSASGKRGMVSPLARPTARSCTGPPPLETPDRSGFPSERWGVGPFGAGITRCCPPWAWADSDINATPTIRVDDMTKRFATAAAPLFLLILPKRLIWGVFTL